MRTSYFVAAVLLLVVALVSRVTNTGRVPIVWRAQHIASSPSQIEALFYVSGNPVTVQEKLVHPLTTGVAKFPHHARFPTQQHLFSGDDESELEIPSTAVHTNEWKVLDYDFGGLSDPTISIDMDFGSLDAEDDDDLALLRELDAMEDENDIYEDDRTILVIDLQYVAIVAAFAVLFMSAGGTPSDDAMNALSWGGGASMGVTQIDEIEEASPLDLIATKDSLYNHFYGTDKDSSLAGAASTSSTSPALVVDGTSNIEEVGRKKVNFNKNGGFAFEGVKKRKNESEECV